MIYVYTYQSLHSWIISQMQFDYDEMESKLSIIEAKYSSLKSENKRLVNQASTAKEQARQKVEHKN